MESYRSEKEDKRGWKAEFWDTPGSKVRGNDMESTENEKTKYCNVFKVLTFLFCFVFLFLVFLLSVFYFFFATQSSMWDLSSLTRD